MGDVGFLDDGGLVWFGGVLKGREELDVELEVAADTLYTSDEPFLKLFLNAGHLSIGRLFGPLEDDL